MTDKPAKWKTIHAPDERLAALTDPALHERAEWLRRALAGVDRAMELEGIPAEVRRRVTHRLLNGEPDDQVRYVYALDEARPLRLPYEPAPPGS